MLDQTTKDRIESDIAASDVVLFMKGTLCFRNAAFRLLWSAFSAIWA